MCRFNEFRKSHAGVREVYAVLEDSSGSSEDTNDV